MKIIRTTAELHMQAKEWTEAGLSIGLIPTMGYLHEGHKERIALAKDANDRVIVSIFVNPLQFGSREEIDRYPRNEEEDCRIAQAAGADVVFIPEEEDMYPADFTTQIVVGDLAKTLCGKSRPGHFTGISVLICKLCNLSRAHRVYISLTEAQQLAILRRMVRDLNMEVEVIGCPIIRESDGLVVSARNIYLTEQEREAAVVLSKSVELGKKMIADGETNGDKVLGAMRRMVGDEMFAILDYADMVTWDSLETHHTVDCPILVTIAAYIGKTRLLDSFIIE